MSFSHRGFVLRELIKRDFHSRYVGSALGASWSVLHPFWQLVLFTFVFSTVLRIPHPKELTDSFAIFLFAGLVPWIAIQEGVSRAANAITDNAMLVQKLSFPPHLLVTTSVVGGLLQSAFATLILIAALVFRDELSPATLPWLVLVVPFQVLLTLGLGLLFAAVNVFLRDVSQFITIVLNAWFYVTPIVYPLTFVAPSPDMAPEKAARLQLARDLIEANPLTAIVELYRFALMGGEPFTGLGVWVLVGVSLAVFAAGWTLFSRLSPAFADAL